MTHTDQKQQIQEMTDQYGPAYFGRMGASISHDIKNCLAIMNENAGLMSDHLMMARKGLPPDIERFSDIVRRIEKQIARADGIVKSLNTFSHSMDRPEQQTDLDEAVALTLGLGSRIIANKGITVNHIPAPERCHLTGSLFFLLLLIWSILEHVTQTLASGATINVSSSKSDDSQNGICLRFQCEQPFAAGCDSLAAHPALALLNATLVCNDQGTRADLVFCR